MCRGVAGITRWLVCGVVLLQATMAFGQTGGLYFAENGGPSNGTAQAGSAAIASDAETAWLNPAGMTRLERPEAMLTLMPFGIQTEFDSSSKTNLMGGDGGDQGSWAPAGAIYAAVPVHDRVALGFSITSPGGAILDPDDDWVGRTWMTEVELLMINLEPSIGFRINDQWSIGAGLDVQYVTFEQKLRTPIRGNRVKIDGDSWDVGFSFSALWEASETTRIGARYRSEVDHSLSGDLTVNAGEPSISTSFTMPQSVTVSLYEQFTETVAGMADFGWTDWSAYDRNVISFDDNDATVELPRGFRDTWTASVGVHIRPAEDWLVMLGTGYVSSPVRDTRRTPDLPVDQQVRGSIGLDYSCGENWRFGGNYTFAWLGENKIDQSGPLNRRLVGDYEAFAHVIGLYGSYKF